MNEIDKSEDFDIEPDPVIDEVRKFAWLLVEFKGHRRQWFANPRLIPLQIGDYAVVEADRGEDAGIVRAIRENSPDCRLNGSFAVIRSAGENDLAQIERLKKSEAKAQQICLEKVHSHNLRMKLIDTEYRLDGLKLTFYFTAEGRVDFRELVRDLAGAFKTRIELRQIGARDELKRSDGFGVCGQRLCCVNFMNGFQPITTGMAKSQRLILNPIKLSGRCSRLKCCLAFEMPNYNNSDSTLPTLDLPTVIDPDSKMEIVSD